MVFVWKVVELELSGGVGVVTVTGNVSMRFGGMPDMASRLESAIDGFPLSPLAFYGEDPGGRG